RSATRRGQYAAYRRLGVVLAMSAGILEGHVSVHWIAARYSLGSDQLRRFDRAGRPAAAGGRRPIHTSRSRGDRRRRGAVIRLHDVQKRYGRSEERRVGKEGET